MLTNSTMTEHQGNKWWLDEQGKFGRTGAPAVIYSNGDREWWNHGVQTREEGPAVDRADGHKEWIVGGQYIQPNSGPSIVRADGTREWWLGYATAPYLHRTDGAAIERADGTKEYWLYGTRVTEEVWRAKFG